MTYDPDQPRDKNGMWTDVDDAVKRAASDKKYKWPKDHPIVPAIVADTVAGQDRKLADYLEQKALDQYQRSEHFRKMMNKRGNAGRDLLYQFMNTWASKYK